MEEQLLEELETLRAKNRLRACSTVQGTSRVNVIVDGAPLVSFCSNDYLGLASSPALAEASRRAILTSGFGAGASRLVSGTYPEHLALEQALALFLRVQGVLLFPSGYQANLGVLTALARPGDLIVADRAVHASLIDASRLSRAKLALFPHLDTLTAEKLIRRLGPRARRRIILTESIFSMDGDVAPLSELQAIALRYDALLLVDEAHAVGALGPSGSGLCASLAAPPEILVGTLGKAFGVAGAFVAGSRVLRDYLLNHSRSFIFTTAPPPPLAAAAHTALEIISSPEGQRRRDALHSRAVQLRAALNLPDSVPSPIISLVLGDDGRALEASHALRTRGFLVQPIRPPAVREGTARLRVTLSALHTPEEVSALAAALKQVLPRPSGWAPAPSSPFPPQRPARLAGLFLLGTDTGVGKTAAASAILRLLVLRGYRPVPFKPVETGACPIPADAVRLREAAMRSDIDLRDICPFPFPQPLAPLAASAAVGRTISISALASAARNLSTHGSPLVVESAGGLLTPYSDRLTCADLASALGHPVLLVARNALGTINHTALAIGEIRRRMLPLAGVLLVNTTPCDTPDRASNSSLIQRLTGVEPLGVLPFVPDPSPASLADALSRAIDLSRLLDLPA